MKSAVLALGLVAACLGAAEPTSAQDKMIDSLAGSCPVAGAFKSTGKLEVSKTDIAAVLLARNPKLTKAQVDETAAMFIKMGDADKNNAVARTEYLAMFKPAAKPTAK
ncbi:MAG: hypothetical protein AAB263_10585 [Planctomycetota bacterium]